MSELIAFELRELPAFRVIGKEIHPLLDMKENPIPAFWGQCFQDGSFNALEWLGPALLQPDYVGFMCEYEPNAGNVFTYMCGVFAKADTEVPEGYTFRDYPAATVAVGWIKGPEKENYLCAHKFTEGELRAKGYLPGKAGWCAEVYNCPRFTTPAADGSVILDYYIPCEKA